MGRRVALLALLLLAGPAVAQAEPEERPAEGWGSPPPAEEMGLAGEEERPRIRRARILLPACAEPPFSAEELLVALRVELLDQGIELGPGESGADPQAIIGVDTPTCSADEIRVRVENSLTGQEDQRTIDLADRPDEERSRVLGLAIAELVRDALPRITAPTLPAAELPSSPYLPPPPVASPAPAQEIDVDALRADAVDEALEALEDRLLQEEADEERLLPRSALGVALAARLYPMYGGVGIGPHLTGAFAATRSGRVTMLVDVGYGYGGASEELGRVETHLLAAGVAALFGGGTPRLRAAIGPRAELGWAWVVGRPTSDGTSSPGGNGFLLALEAQGSLAVHLGRAIWATIDLHAGAVVVGVIPVTEGRDAAGLAGPVVGLDLGVRFGL